MIEVVPGIYQIQLPLAAHYVTGFTNVYILKGDEGCLMVDTGWDNEASVKILDSQLDEIGLRQSDIKQLIATHCHTDHYSMAERLQRQFHTRIFAHEMDFNLVNTRSNKGDSFQIETDLLLIANGVPAARLAELPQPLPEVVPTRPDILLHGGETISFGEFRLNVLWTPGHSPGHVCVHEPELKILFSGDLILPTIATNIGLHLQYSSNPVGDYLNSLETLKKIDVDLVLPAHEYVFSNLGKRLEELTGYHERKNGAVMKIISDGKPRSAYQVSIAISSRNGSRSRWDNLPPWDKRFAVLETLARLQYLRSRGGVDRFVADGIVFFQAR